ncbi:hypothetical protein [uncultured Cetobacterium sp.]|uniref:hypothetical protein n=1 Tax=uncultured Cetobacterium sp. TaxID=527638 RepID=UPI0026324F47|nr:hypothetical protein [uncultured Cetobacterium sp.]
MSREILMQKEILKHLKEKINDPSLNFYEIFIPEPGLVEKGKSDSIFPFILIRPGKSKRQGYFKRREFELLVAVKSDNDSEGITKIFNLSEEISKILEETPTKNNAYTLDPTTIVEDFDAEDCGENVWGTRIKFQSDIPK